MTWVYLACLGGLTVAVFLVVTRIEQGPSMLDRVAAIDIVTASLIGFVAVSSAMTGRGDLIALLAALALVGFLSTVTIARFAAVESERERRILSREELEALLRAEASRRDQDAPVHDVDGLAAGEGAER